LEIATDREPCEPAVLMAQIDERLTAAEEQ
jgi:hypothetical protein